MHIELIKNVHTRVSGDNKDIHIWFIHGFGETGESFRDIFITTELANNFGLFAPDLPGCGSSEWNDTCATIPGYANLLVDLINTLSSGKKIVLITHSMGSLIGEELTKLLQDKIALFISLEGFLIPDSKRFSYQVLTHKTPDDFHRVMIENVTKQKDTGVVPTSYYEHLLSYDPRTLYYWAKSCYETVPTTGSYYTSLNCPRVFICGSLSARPDELALLKTNPSIEIVIHEGSGHWLMLDVPQFYSLLFDLLQQKLLTSPRPGVA